MLPASVREALNELEKADKFLQGLIETARRQAAQGRLHGRNVAAIDELARLAFGTADGRPANYSDDLTFSQVFAIIRSRTQSIAQAKPLLRQSRSGRRSSLR
jgi:hypothetical protein